MLQNAPTVQMTPEPGPPKKAQLTVALNYVDSLYSNRWGIKLGMKAKEEKQKKQGAD